MTRSTTVLRRGLIAALAVVAAAAGPLPQIAHAAPTASAEVTIPAGQQPGPVGLAMVDDGADGYVLQGNESFVSANGQYTKQYTWYSADGTVSHDLGKLAQAPVIVSLPGGGSVVGTLEADGAAQPPSRIGIYDVASGSWTHYDLPTGQSVVRLVPTATGWAAVTRSVTTAPRALLHVLTPAADGSLADRAVSGIPDGGITGPLGRQVVEGEMEFLSRGTTGWEIGLLDTNTGVLTLSPEISAPNTATLVMNDEFFGFYDEATHRASLRRIDAPQTVAVDLPAMPVDGVAGAAVLTREALILGADGAGVRPGQKSGPVESFPLDGGAPTVLTTAGSTPVQAADGGVTYDGTTAAGGLATYKLPADGTPAVVLRDLPVYHPEGIGLSLDRGRLSRMVTGPGYDVQEHLENADLGTGPTPQLSGQVAETTSSVWDGIVHRCGSARCEALTETDRAADTTAGAAPVYLTTNLQGDDVVLQEGASKSVTLDSSGGRIVAADGSLAVYDGTDGRQYLVDLTKGEVARTRPTTAATLWNGTLWTATDTPGTFTTESTATLTGATGTVTTDAPCVPDEIQALGRWLYWSCGADGPAGVWDEAAGHSVTVPAGHALLGDGYVLRHVGEQLVLTDFHTGTAAPDRTLADLPAGANADDRGITWTVDKYRGFVAYTDADANTHVLPSGVPASPLGVLRSDAAAAVTQGAGGWHAQWTFSGPVSSWRVDIRRLGHTQTLAAVHGGASRGTVSAQWDGKFSSSGVNAPNGSYTWTLVAVPANGDGPDLAAHGTVVLSGGPAADRDYSGDGAGDLLALTSGGRLDLRPGAGDVPGVVRATSASGSGWPSTSRLVPFGDLNGDGVNDLLVRDSAGHLTVYYGTSGHTFTPANPHRLIGAGWNIYDVLTSPGDTNSDGRADLIARDAHGDLYLYKAKASGVFAERTQVGHGYQIYDMMVGAQDLGSYPGFAETGDFLARDRSGVLWLYSSDGGGRIDARTRIGAGWNVYNAIVGVGDVDGDGDGWHDVIARDTSGDLWFYHGRGSNRFLPRVKIGWAWQTYTSLL